jgi:hydroxymethylbilane synthase
LLLAGIDDESSRATTTAERAFLSALGGGCAAPVAAHARVESGRVRMQALVSSPDGSSVVRVSGEGEPEELGERLAREALAAGAGRILEAIHG